MKNFKIHTYFLIFFIFIVQCSKSTPSEPEDSQKEIKFENAEIILEGPVNLFDISDNFPDVMIANIHRNGIYKTNDAGETWNKIYSASIIDMCIDDSSPSTIFQVVPT